MVLVDTSVWVDHLRSGDDQLRELLLASQVAMHPMIIGELACGNLSNRRQLQEYWQHLPGVQCAADDEAMYVLESRNLFGRGIGFVDLHLVAACLLSHDTLLWTQDKRLGAVAKSLGLSFHAVI